MKKVTSNNEILKVSIPETSKRDYEIFQKELEHIINKYSLENGSNTPDFILAEYLTNCLKAFNKCSRKREKWFGKSLHI